MTDDSRKQLLLDAWQLMDERNRELGLRRYDFGDTLSHPLLYHLSKNRVGRVIVKALRAPELVAPILWRRVLRVPRYVVPSVFYHLGLTYLGRERIGGAEPFDRAHADHVAEEALGLRIDAEHACWRHPYRHHASAWRTNDAADRPPSCAHHTGRVGLMLVRVGQAHGRDDFVEAGVSAARALLTYHRWHEHDDGSRTVSYYPFSDDEIINTGADAAALLAAVPAPHRTPEMQQALDGLVRMVVAEQQPGGSWHYCTRRHYERFGGERVIDNHHTAMVLGALARVITSGSLADELREPVTDALRSGAIFYLREMVLPDGDALYYPGRDTRAGVVGHSEGISSLCSLLRAGLLPPNLAGLARPVPARMLERAILRFLDTRTGDVACCHFFGRPYQIRSARWGSAPLMQAVTDYVDYAGDEA